MDKIAEKLAITLEKAKLALNDWQTLQASEAFNEHSILEAHERVFECGVVAYINSVKDEINKVLDEYKCLKNSQG